MIAMILQKFENVSTYKYVKHLKFPKQKWMSGLREKCQNDVLHGNVHMDTSSEWMITLILREVSKCQYVKIYLCQ